MKKGCQLAVLPLSLEHPTQEYFLLVVSKLVGRESVQSDDEVEDERAEYTLTRHTMAPSIQGGG